MNKKSQLKCILHDWSGSEAKVAEGRILSSDPEDFINDIPLGPNSVKVLVETAIKTDAFLWRPAPDMFTVAQAVGEIIAWPQCFAALLDNGVESEDIDPKVRFDYLIQTVRVTMAYFKCLNTNVFCVFFLEPQHKFYKPLQANGLGNE